MNTYRETLIAIYLDWLNNYASLDTFADHNGLYIEQAKDLIRIAKDVYNSDHPDA
jgi:hypothetical protein